MRYEYIMARFLLALTALLWTGVLGTEGPVKSDGLNDQETTLEIEPAHAPAPKNHLLCRI